MEIWLDFGWIFDPAVQILLLLCGWSTLSGLAPGARLAKPTYPPIYLVLKYNKLQFTKILKCYNPRNLAISSAFLKKLQKVVANVFGLSFLENVKRKEKQMKLRLRKFVLKLETLL